MYILVGILTCDFNLYFPSDWRCWTTFSWICYIHITSLIKSFYFLSGCLAYFWVLKIIYTLQTQAPIIYCFIIFSVISFEEQKFAYVLNSVMKIKNMLLKTRELKTYLQHNTTIKKQNSNYILSMTLCKVYICYVYVCL